MKKLLLALAGAAGLWAQSSAQSVDTAMLLERLGSSWPQHNGDCTGQRFSPLKQINTSNVGSLTRGRSRRAPRSRPRALMVDGVVYFSVPDNVWAADARTGKEIWHFSRTSLGDHLASRGVTLFKNQIYFGTPDAHLISLDAKTGAKNWEVCGRGLEVRLLHQRGAARRERQTAGRQCQAISSTCPFLEARDLNDGKLVWRWDAIPKPGEPGSETWPNKEIMAHGGGATWVQGVYDPQLNLTYWGQSASSARGERAQGREPVHVLARGARRGYGQVEVHPDVAARHARSRRRTRRRF